eukprot:3785769-Rhodomonas_salina.2
MLAFAAFFDGLVFEYGDKVQSGVWIIQDIGLHRHGFWACGVCVWIFYVRWTKCVQHKTCKLSLDWRHLCDGALSTPRVRRLVLRIRSQVVTLCFFRCRASTSATGIPLQASFCKAVPQKRQSGPRTRTLLQGCVR